jgi:hypothetical protein
LRNRALPFAALLLLASIATASEAFGCTATRECVGAAAVQCLGSSSCQASPSGVRCDGGATISCPGNPSNVGYVETSCEVPPFSHAFVLFSYSVSGATCSATNVSTTCGGSTAQSCYYCEQHPNECDMPFEG